MADVNVTQTYRINIETNKDFNKAINNLELLKKELSEIDKSISNLNYEPLSKLTTAMNRLAKIDIGKISANIRRLSNVDFGKLTDISRSMNGLNVTPLSQLINVVNRIANLDLTKLDYMNYTFSKLGDVNFDGLRKFNEEIKDLDAEKMYMVSSAMLNISRSSKDSFKKLNGAISQTTDELAEAGRMGIKLNSVIDSLKSKIKELKEKSGFNFNFKNMFKGLLKEGTFMLRFIKYRIMNAITRAISMAFAEGVKAVYEWASITGNEFVGVMDRITTSTFYAKNALGALGANILTALEPVIISLCDWLVKAVDLVSMFVAKISGQDYYLSVATKTFKSYGDAINGVNKALGTLAGFDEINNIGSSSSSAGGSTTGVDEGTFKKVNLEDAFKGKTWLESLALTIRDVFFDWSELNGEQIAEKAVTGLFGLIGLALGGLKGAILGVGLSLLLNSVIFDHDGKLSADEIFKSFLAIITPIIGAILGWTILPGSSVAAGIGIAIGLFYALKFMGFKEGLDKTAEEAAKGNFHKPEHILVTEQGVGEVLKYFDELKANIGIKTQEIFDNIGLWLQNTGFTISTNFNGIKDSAIDIWDIFSTNFGLMLEEDKLTVSDAWTNIKNSIVNNLSEAKTNASLKAVEMFNSVTKVWANLKKFSSDTWGNIKLGWNTMWSNLNTNFRTQGNKILSNFESWINFFIDGFNNLTRGIRSLGNDVLEFLDIDFRFNDIRRISLPRLATGTNYVPQDTLAMLHQGEAVVPKKFNSEEFFGGDSEETNELLRELISVVRKKNFSITKKEVGEASVDYIRSQTRLKGASVI